MAELDNTIKQVLTQLLEVNNATHSDDHFETIVLDLITTPVSFCISKWAVTTPQDPTLGMLLLGIQMSCLHYIEQKGWTVQVEPNKKEG